MGWVPEFKYDIFISYARVDDLTALDEPQPGWITRFHDRLRVALNKKIGRADAISIWRDTRQIQANQFFDRSIHDAVEGAALLVAIDSHGYQQSPYCSQELAWFHAKARLEKAGLAPANHCRIVHLLLNNLPPHKWRMEFEGTEGFAFHNATGPEQDGEPVDPVSDTFHSRLSALVEAIYQTLECLKEAAVTSEPVSAANAASFSIFLADTPDSLNAVRKRVFNELKASAGLSVSSGVPPPFEDGAHEARARREIEAADLSVHLLDLIPGREIDGREGITYPQRQVEVALEFGKSQLIWVPKTLSIESIEDKSYAAFLDRLENGQRARASYDFQRDSPNAISRQILARVEEAKSSAQARAGSPGDAVLLETHRKDEGYAVELYRYLLSQNVRPYLDPQDDNPGRNFSFLTQWMKEVGILILFYGAVAEEWVRNRLRELLKLAIEQECPLRACGVYVAPPRKPGSLIGLSLPLVSVEWMDHTQGFNARAIDLLLHRARAAGAAGASGAAS